MIEFDQDKRELWESRLNVYRYRLEEDKTHAQVLTKTSKGGECCGTQGDKLAQSSLKSVQLRKARIYRIYQKLLTQPRGQCCH